MTVIVRGSELLVYLAEREGRAMKSDVDLRIWSVWPAEVEDPARIPTLAASGRLFDEGDERPLPWTIPETLGQTWGNVFSGELVEVARIGHEQGRPDRLLPCGPGVSRDVHGQVLQGCEDDHALAFWDEARCVVASWVRIDHLSRAMRVRWFTEVRIPYVEQAIQRSLAFLHRDLSPQVRSVEDERLGAWTNELRAAQQAVAELVQDERRSDCAAAVAPDPGRRADVVQARMF